MSFLLRCTQVGLWALVVLLAGCAAPSEPVRAVDLVDVGLLDVVDAAAPCDSNTYQACTCASGQMGGRYCHNGVMSQCSCPIMDPPTAPDTLPPGPCWPADCVHLGLLCEPKQGKCVQCRQTSDCDPLQTCVQNQCIQSQCPAGQAFCVGNWPAICGGDGASYAIAATACGPGTGCRNGHCEPQVCGNAVVEGTEVCDSPQEPTACTAHCLQPGWDQAASFGPQVQRVTQVTLLPMEVGCDLDADGKPNNALGRIVKLYKELYNVLQEDMEAGQWGLAFAAGSWPTGDGPAPLGLFEVTAAPGYAGCLAAGPTTACALLVSRDGVDLASPATAVAARTAWPDAQVSGAKLTGPVLAGNGTAESASFVLPFLAWVVRMPVDRLTVTAKVTPGGGWQQGQLCGAVKKEDLLDFVQAMSDETAATVGGKAQLFSLLSSLIAPDLGPNKYGQKDALSFALGFETTPATLVGLAGGKANKCPAGDATCLTTCAKQHCVAELAQCGTKTQCVALETCQFGHCTDCSSLTDNSAADQCLNACAAVACKADLALCQGSSCQNFLQCVNGCTPGSAVCISACTSVVLDAGGQAALQRRETCLAAAKRHCQ